MCTLQKYIITAMADLGEPKFSQFHAVFRKNLAKSYVGAPRGLAPPPMGNPRSAPVNYKIEGESLFLILLNLLHLV